jgi:hypothetical protein
MGVPPLLEVRIQKAEIRRQKSEGRAEALARAFIAVIRCFISASYNCQRLCIFNS